MANNPPKSFPQQSRPVTMAPHGLEPRLIISASQAGVDMLKKGGLLWMQP